MKAYASSTVEAVVATLKAAPEALSPKVDARRMAGVFDAACLDVSAVVKALGYVVLTAEANGARTLAARKEVSEKASAQRMVALAIARSKIARRSIVVVAFVASTVL